jgi:hypothetical protein
MSDYVAVDTRGFMGPIPGTDTDIVEDGYTEEDGTERYSTLLRHWSFRADSDGERNHLPVETVGSVPLPSDLSEFIRKAYGQPPGSSFHTGTLRELKSHLKGNRTYLGRIITEYNAEETLHQPGELAAAYIGGPVYPFTLS